MIRKLFSKVWKSDYEVNWFLVITVLMVGAGLVFAANKPVEDRPLRVELRGRLFSSTSEWGHDSPPPSYYLMLPEEEAELKGGDASYLFMFATPTQYMRAEQWVNRPVVVHGQLLIEDWGNSADGEPRPASRTVLVHSLTDR